MGLKRRLRVCRRCLEMPWFDLRTAWLMMAPTWLRRAVASRIIPCRQMDEWDVVHFPNGDKVAAPPGAARPVLEVLTQYQAACYQDYYEARLALRAGDVVIDGGAGFGTFTLLAWKLVGPTGKVVAIEPEPRSVRALEGTVAANEMANVKIVPHALGAEVAEATLAVPERDLDEATLRPELGHVGPTAYTCTVKVEPLDHIVSRLGLARVDFIKLNIEGMERAALEGARETIRRWKPRLAISAAHEADDLDVLPKLIRSIEPSYVVAVSRPAWGMLPVLLAAPDGRWSRGSDALHLGPPRLGDLL